ncbi:hypothetical protein COP2_032974 [Malus domestica]
MQFVGCSIGSSGGAPALALCLLALISLSCAARLNASSRQKLDVHKHPNRLNKPSVKSIKVSSFSLTLHSFFIKLSWVVFKF